MRAIALCLAIIPIIAACREPKTAEDECRNRNTLRRVGRGVSSAQNPVADTLEESRCDEIGREERAERKERAAEAKAERARRAELDRQTNAALAQIRSSPRVPEIGAPLAELKVICGRQRGQFFTKAPYVGCTVGGPAIFACQLDDDGNLVTRCDGYYEGADLSDSRRRIEEKLGQPERVGTSAEGFRIFIWAGGTVQLTMYDRGVRMTTATPGAAPRE